MSGQQKKSEQLKQQLLDQIKTQQEAVEALSDEELESVSGGLVLAATTHTVPPVHAALTVKSKYATEVVRNANTVVVFQSRTLIPGA